VIELKIINEDNVLDIIKLWTTLDDYQKSCVAPNAVSLAQAYASKRAWPRAIYDNQTPVGFVMLALHDDDIPKEDQPSYYLWRFMIAKEYQNKGIGKKVLDLIYAKAKEDKQKYLYTSCEVEGDMPYAFYMSYGFEDINIKDGSEEILKIRIK
jgi:diamine N-acetyltransferase